MNLEDVLLRGLRASQPTANTVASGTLYFVTDEGVTERSNGTSWESYSAPKVTPVVLYGDEYHISNEILPAPGSGSSGSGSGKYAQIVKSESGAAATSSTIIPFDDTIPQNTEGVEIFTVSITPQNASSILIIEATIFATVTATPWIIVALFQDTTANALATVASFNNLSTAGTTIPLRHFMTAGTTSSTTFKIRIGPSSAATVTLNGQSGVRIFGGVAASSLSVTEILP